MIESSIFNGFTFDVPVNRTIICVALAIIIVVFAVAISVLIYLLRRNK